MKKIHLIAAAAALLISGGVFMKVNNTNDYLLDENIEAFTEDPEQGSGTCGYVVYMADTYIRSCRISYSEAYGEYCRWVYNPINPYSANWCCDSCKDTWYCGGN